MLLNSNKHCSENGGGMSEFAEFLRKCSNPFSWIVAVDQYFQWFKLFVFSILLSSTMFVRILIFS